MTTYIQNPTKEELTPKGFTNRITIATSQSKESLLAYGFTNHSEPTLYYCKMIHKNISFNLSVSVDTLEITNIDVLDEDWLQPYDYQAQILSGNFTKAAEHTYNKVNNILETLQQDGIITGFEKGMYI